MNPTESTPPPPLPSKAPEPAPKPSRYAILPHPDGDSNLVQNLLQRPGSIMHDLAGAGVVTRYRNLALLALLGLAAFGFLLGTFSGGTQLWAAPAKVVLGLLGSGLICFPSLYIFSCLSGIEQPPLRVLSVFVTGFSVLALLLLGFAPIVWVFSQSSDSAVFLGVLSLLFYLIALSFGLRLMFEFSRELGMKQSRHLVIWAGIFMIVTLQMTSSLRPILGTSDTFLPKEKKFFLTHWFDSMTEKVEDDGAMKRR